VDKGRTFFNLGVQHPAAAAAAAAANDPDLPDRQQLNSDLDDDGELETNSNSSKGMTQQQGGQQGTTGGLMRLGCLCRRPRLG